MKPILIEATDKSPAVNFDAEKGVLIIRGRSIPEHTVEFYKPVQAWADEYILAPKEKTILDLTFEYYNTSSSKSIMDFLKKFAKAFKEKGMDVKVIWRYEEDDEDICDAGSDFQLMCGLSFEMVSFPVDE